jgi:OmpR-family two-component system manganese-sensing sensor histidine kinase
MFRRSRRDLARWFTFLTGSILVAFAIAVYYREVASELATVDRSLYQRTRVMATNVRYRFQEGEWQLDLENVPLLGDQTVPLNSSLVYARWYDDEGQLVQFFGVPTADRLLHEPGFQTVEILQDNNLLMFERLRQLTMPIYRGGALLGYLQVATPLTTVEVKLNEFRMFVALAVPISVGLISWSSWLLGGVAMLPIRQTHQQLERFTADASHELRAPLTAILNNAQVGLMADAAEQQWRLQNVAALAESMSSLVSSLLLLARYPGTFLSESLKCVDLTPLLQELTDEFAAQSIAQSLHLTHHLPAEPVMVNAEPYLLRQAIACLLNNACNYTPAGGEVQLRLTVTGHRAIIQVEDNGVGIPAEDLPHLFERFYRVDKERSRQTGGFGLGLAIAQQVVAAHRGKLSVESILGTGSTFQIELPLTFNLEA